MCEKTDQLVGPLRADEDVVETLDEMIVLESAPRTLGQATAVAEADRDVRGLQAAIQRGRLGSSLDSRRSSTSAAGPPSGAARRAGEHIVRVHRSEDQTLAERPARAAEPTRDPTSRTTLSIGVVRQRSEAGETDGVQVEHPPVVHHRHGDVRRVMMVTRRRH